MDRNLLLVPLFFVSSDSQGREKQPLPNQSPKHWGENLSASLLEVWLTPGYFVDNPAFFLMRNRGQSLSIWFMQKHKIRSFCLMNWIVLPKQHVLISWGYLLNCSILSRTRPSPIITLIIPLIFLILCSLLLQIIR